ncbi:MAG TPA: hypothetical protein VF049_21320 [Nocardioidaceae bacterium]
MTTATKTLTPAEAVAAARADRDAAMAAAEAADITGWDKHVIDQAITAFANTGRPFSANDIRPLLGDVRSSLMGSRFMAASVRGQIRRVGRVTSLKKNTHCKDIDMWVRATQEEASA